MQCWIFWTFCECAVFVQRVLICLNRPLEVSGSPMFDSQGQGYYHVFNMSLCGGSPKYPLVQCSNNISTARVSSKVFSFWRQVEFEIMIFQNSMLLFFGIFSWHMSMWELKELPKDRNTNDSQLRTWLLKEHHTFQSEVKAYIFQNTLLLCCSSYPPLLSTAVSARSSCFDCCLNGISHKKIQ